MRNLRGMLLCSAAVALAPISGAVAQDAADDIIVVTGIKGSLNNHWT